ncbi:MAG: hypothetical protein WC010_00360 [Candidatus Absconditabacterales bacterium]
MLKTIQKHTHAFLFFLGGLFLMLVGPSLIPTSSAATASIVPTIIGNVAYVLVPNIYTQVSFKLDTVGVQYEAATKAIVERTTAKGNFYKSTLSYKGGSEVVLGFGAKGLVVDNGLITYKVNLFNIRGTIVGTFYVQAFTDSKRYETVISAANGAVERNVMPVKYQGEGLTTTRQTDPVIYQGEGLMRVIGGKIISIYSLVAANAKTAIVDFYYGGDDIYAVPTTAKYLEIRYIFNGKDTYRYIPVNKYNNIVFGIDADLLLKTPYTINYVDSNRKNVGPVSYIVTLLTKVDFDTTSKYLEVQLVSHNAAVEMDGKCPDGGNPPCDGYYNLLVSKLQNTQPNRPTIATNASIVQIVEYFTNVFTEIYTNLQNNIHIVANLVSYIYDNQAYLNERVEFLTNEYYNGLTAAKKTSFNTELNLINARYNTRVNTRVETLVSQGLFTQAEAARYNTFNTDFATDFAARQTAASSETHGAATNK